jgi:eukaryotic-like serine/threonine-protein kinase
LSGAPSPELNDRSDPDTPTVERQSGPGTSAVTSDPLLGEIARISGAPLRRMHAPELLPGERLGRFHIVSKLGQGAMGAVYEAEDRTLGRRIALKVLLIDDDERQRRFTREARSAAAVTHPNIAMILDVGEDEGRAFIVMELVRGRTLRGLLAGGPLPIADAVRFADGIARGLARAHAAGIVHRDLKPENVMVADGGDVKLLDFGLAKCVDPGAALVTEPSGEAFTTGEEGRVLGTPPYMSPEQILGRKVDARSDVFSFGVMLYEMVTGRRPFEGRTRQDPVPPSRVDARTPAAVERIILRCLRTDPQQRYGHGAELLADLGPVLTSTARPELRRALLPWILAAAAIVAAGVLAVGYRAGPSPERAAPSASPPASASAPEAESASNPASPRPSASVAAPPATTNPARPVSRNWRPPTTKFEPPPSSTVLFP